MHQRKNYQKRSTKPDNWTMRIDQPQTHNIHMMEHHHHSAAHLAAAADEVHR